jgi:hypothetical protein
VTFALILSDVGSRRLTARVAIDFSGARTCD